MTRVSARAQARTPVRAPVPATATVARAVPHQAVSSDQAGDRHWPLYVFLAAFCLVATVVFSSSSVQEFWINLVL
jgi:hypothetical protein